MPCQDILKQNDLDGTKSVEEVSELLSTAAREYGDRNWKQEP